MEVFGQTVAIRHPADAIARGLVHLLEERKAEGIFPLLSINENAALPSYGRFSRIFGLDFSQAAREVADFVPKIRIKLASGEDRILFMHEGRIKGVQRAEAATQESLLQLAMT